MKKKKIKKELKKLNKRLDNLEPVKQEIRQIGFDYLFNYHDYNEFDEE